MIFQRSGHEATLALELARGHPLFDPSLSLCAEVEGETAGWAMVLPTHLRLRGAWVPLGIVGPYGTLPQHQGTGVGRYLIEVALSALSERGLVDDGAVDRCVAQLEKAGHVYLQDGTRWFRSSAFGESTRAALRGSSRRSWPRQIRWAS